MATAPVHPWSFDEGRAILLITGAPGAGKSTVSRLVADTLTKSALIDAYYVSTLIRSGRVWALGEPRDEAARQVQLCNRNTCTLATSLADAGFTPIIDTVVPDREQLDTFRESLGQRLRVVVLDPGTAACVQRNAGRPEADQFFFDGYETLRASMRDGLGHAGRWLDSSHQTPQQTARDVLAHCQLTVGPGASEVLPREQRA